MIFVTVGTHHQPFDRLLDALDQLDPEELVVQHGPGRAPAGAAVAAPFMPFDEMLRWFRQADKVISHAGVGSILCARREGQVPVVVPRRYELGEHVDDHQSELTRALEQRGSLVALWDVDRLAPTVAAAPTRSSAAELPTPPLCGAVRAALLGEPAQSSDS